MSSFISNFKSEARVLAVVALALGACELAMRAGIRRVSVDARHLEVEIPSMAGKKPRVVMLGNSLTRAGIVPSELGLKDAAFVHPDDTTIADWHYLYGRYFLSTNVLLVPFAADHLADSSALHLDRLGGYFAGLELIEEAFGHDVREFDGRASYLLAALSSAYANRERVRTQLFAFLIPHYRRSSQALNQVMKASGKAPARRYTRLARFLERVRSAGTKVVFIRMPVPRAEPLDPALKELLGPRLLDLSRVEGLTPGDFPDGYHLSPRGASVVTRRLGVLLQALKVPQLEHQQRP